MDSDIVKFNNIQEFLNIRSHNNKAFEKYLIFYLLLWPIYAFRIPIQIRIVLNNTVFFSNHYKNEKLWK